MVYRALLLVLNTFMHKDLKRKKKLGKRPHELTCFLVGHVIHDKKHQNSLETNLRDFS